MHESGPATYKQLHFIGWQLIQADYSHIRQRFSSAKVGSFLQFSLIIPFGFALTLVFPFTLLKTMHQPSSSSLCLTINALRAHILCVFLTHLHPQTFQTMLHLQRLAGLACSEIRREREKESKTLRLLIRCASWMITCGQLSIRRPAARFSFDHKKVHLDRESWPAMSDG